MKKLLPILLLLLLLLSLHAFSTNYYVSSVSGDDANAGTLQFPWRTLSKVSSFNFSAGDIINLSGGEIFNGFLVINNSGTLASPITYRSYGTGQAIISGFTSVSSFNSIGGNVWEGSTSPSTLATANVVLINGVNYAMGRYPNSGYLTYQSFTSTSITSSSLNSAVINWTGAEAVIRKNNFVTERDLITSASAGSLFYTSTGITGNNNYGFFIQNDFRTLDAQNEWYYNPTTKKLRIYSTVSPTNVQVANVDTLFYSVFRNYITVDGLDFQGANENAILIGSCNNFIVRNCNISFNGNRGIYGQNFGGTSHSFQCYNNTFNNNNNTAINSGTGTWSFTTNNQTLSNTINTGGSPCGATFNNIIISGAITLTLLLEYMTVTGTINGDNAGSIFDNRSTLHYQNATAPMVTGLLYCNQATNTWFYDLAGGQDIQPPSDPATPGYKNLILAGSGAKRLLGNVSVKGTYTLTAPATLDLNGFTLTNP